MILMIVKRESLAKSKIMHKKMCKLETPHPSGYGVSRYLGGLGPPQSRIQNPALYPTELQV